MATTLANRMTRRQARQLADRARDHRRREAAAMSEHRITAALLHAEQAAPIEHDLRRSGYGHLIARPAGL